jgi:hypothetical protein
MKSLKQTFMKHMIGPLSGIAVGLAAAVTILPVTSAEAQTRPTTIQDVNDFTSAAVQFDQKFSEITPAQAARINALYAEMQEFYLADPTRPNPHGFLSDITNHAGAVAGAYDMGQNRLYTDLMATVGVHSLYAETFLTLTQQNMGQNLELAHADHPDFVGLKFQAMIDVQFRLARFVEESSKLLADDPNLSNQTFASFSTLCHLAQRFETDMHDLHMTLIPENNAGTAYAGQMTVEDPTTGYRQSMVCTKRPGR